MPLMPSFRRCFFFTPLFAFRFRRFLLSLSSRTGAADSGAHTQSDALFRLCRDDVYADRRHSLMRVSAACLRIFFDYAFFAD